MIELMPTIEDKTALLVIASYRGVSRNPVRFKALVQTWLHGCLTDKPRTMLPGIKCGKPLPRS